MQTGHPNRMLEPQAEPTALYDVVCQACNHHQVTRTMATSCSKCQSLVVVVTPAKGTYTTR